MDIPITTPALLFPAIAILMLGYVNRYLGIANIIRSFKKDYDAGYVHVKIVEQLKVLKLRIELSRTMLALGAISLMFACLSMYFIYLGQQEAGNAAFGMSILGMIFSLGFSIYETGLSNKSLMVEIDDIFAKEKKASK